MNRKKLKQVYEMLGGEDNIGTTQPLAEQAWKMVKEILDENRSETLKLWIMGVLTGATGILLILSTKLLIEGLA